MTDEVASLEREGSWAVRSVGPGRGRQAGREREGREHVWAARTSELGRAREGKRRAGPCDNLVFLFF
jgi:hypothetical protein